MRLIHRMMRAWRLRARDEGAVTAEFAVALPAVIAVLALCLSAAAVGIAQSRLEESRELRRVPSLGEITLPPCSMKFRG